MPKHVLTLRSIGHWESEGQKTFSLGGGFVRTENKATIFIAIVVIVASVIIPIQVSADGADGWSFAIRTTARGATGSRYKTPG